MDGEAERWWRVVDGDVRPRRRRRTVVEDYRWALPAAGSTENRTVWKEGQEEAMGGGGAARQRRRWGSRNANKMNRKNEEDDVILPLFASAAGGCGPIDSPAQYQLAGPVSIGCCDAWIGAFVPG